MGWSLSQLFWQDIFLHVMVYSAQMVGFSETSCFRNRLKAVYLVANAVILFSRFIKKAHQSWVVPSQIIVDLLFDHHSFTPNIFTA